MPRYQMIQCRSEPIDICPCVGLPMASELFRCSISLRTQKFRIIYTMLLIFSCYAKVNQRNAPIRFEHNIFRF